VAPTVVPEAGTAAFALPPLAFALAGAILLRRKKVIPAA